jgi:hypothetical protein
MPPIDLVGTSHGQLSVLSKAFSKNRKVFWNVQCNICSRLYELTTDRIKANVNGCNECARINTPRGKDSQYWRGGEYISSIFLSNVKRGARKRGIECNVTLAELDLIWAVQGGRCAYTNRKLSLTSDNCTASLDRIDSSVGYFSYNVQFVHKNVNVAKWAMLEEDFLAMIKEIYEYRSLNVSNGIYQEQLPIL